MTIPDELRRSTPRRVGLTLEGRKTVLSYCLRIVVLVAVGTWLVMQSVHEVRGMTLATWLRFGAGIIIAAAVGFLGFRRRSRLLMYGRATVARMTGEATPWWYRLYRKRQIRRWHCEFQLLSGGVCKTTIHTRGKVPAPDEEIVVVYDPDQPEKAMLYPDRLLKVAAFE